MTTPMQCLALELVFSALAIIAQLLVRVGDMSERLGVAISLVCVLFCFLMCFASGPVSERREVAR